MGLCVKDSHRCTDSSSRRNFAVRGQTVCVVTTLMALQKCVPNPVSFFRVTAMILNKNDKTRAPADVGLRANHVPRCSDSGSQSDFAVGYLDRLPYDQVTAAIDI